MKLREDEVRITAPDCEIRSILIRPVGEGPWPAVLFYSDIFQLTESTLRTARRLASHGFAVCAPEIYPRDLAGQALEFDDAGKASGLAGAAATTTAQFDSDRVAVLDHLVRRPDITERLLRRVLHRRSPRVPCGVRRTGGGDGLLLPHRAARREARRGRRQRHPGAGRGRRRPDDGRLRLERPARPRRRAAPDPVTLYAAGAEHLELHIYAGGEHAFMRDIGPRHDPDITDAALAEAVSFLTRR